MRVYANDQMQNKYSFFLFFFLFDLSSKIVFLTSSFTFYRFASLYSNLMCFLSCHLFWYWWIIVVGMPSDGQLLKEHIIFVLYSHSNSFSLFCCYNFSLFFWLKFVFFFFSFMVISVKKAYKYFVLTSTIRIYRTTAIGFHVNFFFAGVAAVVVH